MAGPIALLEKLITEHGSSSILRDRLIQIREDLTRVEQEKDRLQAECQQLKQQVKDLQKELEAKAVPDEYTEHRGVLFRRVSGSIQDEAYCPECKIPMTSLMGATPLRCSKCRRTASFTGNDIRRIISEIR